jgi:hypothetical protein
VLDVIETRLGLLAQQGDVLGDVRPAVKTVPGPLDGMAFKAELEPGDFVAADVAKKPGVGVAAGFSLKEGP